MSTRSVLSGASEAPEQPIEFGVFVFDPQARELRKHGIALHIAPQALAVLGLLLKRPGEIVTREELRNQLWPDTHVDFEGNLNAIIRDLREALLDSARHPRYIETRPKQGYRFIAPVSAVSAKPAPRIPAPAATPPAPARRAFRYVYAVGLILVAAAVLLSRGLLRRSAAPLRAGRIVQITNYVGSEGHPSFSPDGARVVFHWNGSERTGFDIYVKQIGSEQLLQLTATPEDDVMPAWSPDGRDIAFLRRLAGKRSAIMLISALGGVERQVQVVPTGGSFAWSPDGQWIAYSGLPTDYLDRPPEGTGLYAISLQTGRKRQLTRPSSAVLGDVDPAFSPDGRRVAFFRTSSTGANDLYVADIGPGLVPAGEPRKLTSDSRGARSPVWTPDGKAILFTSDRGGLNSLWRISPLPNSKPVAVGGEDVFTPAVDAAGRRVIYERAALVDRLSSIELCGPGCASGPLRRLVFSPKLARNPAYSPDGRHIAFESSRSGNTEIWVCDRDGSNARQLTFFNGPLTGTPRWSPDGAWLAFDSRVQGKGKIFVVPAAGGQPRQLTFGPHEDIVPNWSRDGRSIYFVSDRTGEFQIWKMPAGAGAPVQITRKGGFHAAESFDGKTLYYSKGIIQTALWMTPSGGGEEIQLIPSLSYWPNFSVTRDGIYFVPGAPERHASVHMLDFASRRTIRLANIEVSSPQGLSVSPDARDIILVERESSESDLMLMELVP
jgi:Tol biopolymer transport system component/DNA-binding winged helix-turn-helix (wHTH) protein